MRNYYLFFVLLAATAVTLTRADAAKAQTVVGTSLVSPSFGETFYADSDGKRSVWVQSAPYNDTNSTGHFIRFAGPINGTVTWTMALSAGFGSGPSESGTVLQPNEQVPIEAAHSANTGSAVLNLANPTDTHWEAAGCYGNALFDSTTRHGATGVYARASVEFKLPGVKLPYRQGSNVTFTIVYP